MQPHELPALADVVLRLADVCEQLAIPYAIGGAVATSFWGVPRTTQTGPPPTPDGPSRMWSCRAFPSGSVRGQALFALTRVSDTKNSPTNEPLILRWNWRWEGIDHGRTNEP